MAPFSPGCRSRPHTVESDVGPRRWIQIITVDCSCRTQERGRPFPWAWLPAYHCIHTVCTGVRACSDLSTLACTSVRGTLINVAFLHFQAFKEIRDSFIVVQVRAYGIHVLSTASSHCPTLLPYRCDFTASALLTGGLKLETRDTKHPQQIVYLSSRTRVPGIRERLTPYKEVPISLSVKRPGV